MQHADIADRKGEPGVGRQQEPQQEGAGHPSPQKEAPPSGR